MNETNKVVVRRWYEEVVNTGDVRAIADYIAADYTEVHAGVRHAIGIDGAREHVLGVRRTYPDLRLTIERQIAEGEWVATQATMRGTQRVTWAGIEPTGRPIEVTVVNMDRVVAGRIVEHGGAADLLTPLLASGAVRPAPRGG